MRDFITLEHRKRRSNYVIVPEQRALLNRNISKARCTYN